mgnify:FL=1
MVKTVMKETGMSNNVQLTGITLFAYLVAHFKMTPDEAIIEMKEHGQDTKDAEKMAKELNKNNETLTERK